MSKIIGISSDHAGFKLKSYIIEILKNNLQYDVIDFGTDCDSSVDYPDFVHLLASEVNKGKLPVGIIICGTGNGVSITANKYPEIRAALCWNTEIAELARKHNNANVLSLPARFISESEAVNIVSTFLNTGFEGGRHQARIEKINKTIM